MAPGLGRNNTCSRSEPGASRKSWRWRAALLSLAAWQLGMFVLAVVTSVSGRGQDSPEIPETVQTLLSSMVAPSTEAVQASLRRISETHELHEAAKKQLRGALGRVYAGESPEAVALELRAAVKQEPPLYQRFLGRLDWQQHLPLVALQAVGDGCYDPRAIPHLQALPELPGYGASTWSRAAAFGEALILLDQERFDEVAESLAASHGDFEWETQEARGLLSRLGAHPSDVDAQLGLAGVLCRLSHGNRFLLAKIDLYWRMYRRVDDSGHQARIMLELARLGTFCTANLDDEFTRHLYIAASQLFANQEEYRDQQAAAIAGLADLEERRGNPSRAMAMFGAVFRNFRRTPDWGRSAFNYGLLLRQSGCAKAAADTLSTILPSAVRDQEPSPQLMNAYRNYRHRAALEIARSYGDRSDYPREYYWRYLAARRYPYQSWCGTCGITEAARAKRDLLKCAWRAGPVFVAAYMIAASVHNWLIWTILAAIGAIWWHRRWRHRVVMLPKPGSSPSDEP